MPQRRTRPGTVGAVLDEVLERRQRRHTANTLRVYRWAAEHVRRHLGHRSVRTLGPGDVRELHTRLRRERLAPSSTRYALVVFAAVVDFAQGQGLLSPEQASRLKEATSGRRAKGRPRRSETEGPIDVVVPRLLEHAGATRRNIAVVCARFGWDGGPARTLQEIGDELSITRERVRQLVDATLRKIEGVALPQLDRALRLLERSSPIPVPEAARLLVDAGLATSPTSPRALKILAEHLGYEARFEVRPSTDLVVATDSPTGTTETMHEVLGVAQQLASQAGAASVGQVWAKLGGKHAALSQRDVTRILRPWPHIQFLDDEWFWFSRIRGGRNRLRNTTRHMLSVASPLDLATIRAGLERRYRLFHLTPPPKHVLEAFYSAHPDFVVGPDHTLRPSRPIDYRSELGRTERVLVEILSDAPQATLDRRTLTRRALERGLSPHAISLATTYSPLLENPAPKLWRLRGYRTRPWTKGGQRASATRRR